VLYCAVLRSGRCVFSCPFNSLYI